MSGTTLKSKAAAARRRRRGPRKAGKPRVPTIRAELAPGERWSPAMDALPSDKHRAFVLALYTVPPSRGGYRKRGGATEAARLAGFGYTRTDPATMNVIASQLMSNPRIRAAIAEEDQKRLKLAAPRAIKALADMVETPDHRDHMRAVGMVLDRVHPIATMHEVKIEHSHSIVAETAEVLERIAQIAARVGVDVSGPKLIDVTPRKQK